MNRGQGIGGVLIFLFGVVTVCLSLRMPVGTFRAAGSGLFPLGLGILLMGLSVIFIFKSWVMGRTAEVKEPQVKVPRSARQVIFFAGAVAVATLFLKEFGYPLVSFLLLFSLLRILGVKRWTYGLSLSLFTAAGAYLLFVLWLQIPLPRGWIGL